MYPDVTHTCYTDNISVLGRFDNIELYFNSLKHFGPCCRYYPEPSKFFLIVHPYNLAAGKEFGLRLAFKVFTGARYLGVFIVPQALSIWCKNFFTILSISEGKIRSRTDKKRSRTNENDLSLVVAP